MLSTPDDGTDSCSSYADPCIWLRHARTVYRACTHNNRVKRGTLNTYWRWCSVVNMAVITNRRQALTVVMMQGIFMFSVFAQDRAFIVDQIEKWQKAVSANPRDYETLTRIGAAYGKLGENDKAVTYFNKAIAVRPSYAEAYLGLGTAYGFLQQPENAVIALKKAISLAPNNPFAHGKLGTTLGRAGDYGAAIVELKEAIRLKPDMPDAHFALGLAYFSTGDRQRANSEVGILSRLDPQLEKQLQEILNQR